jgi:D-3-phosphoglycerate dehydrogenase / 2-oxoglutarate reductase
VRLLCPDPGKFSEAAQTLADKYFETTFTELSQGEFEVVAPNYDVLLVRFSTKVSSIVMRSGSRIRYILSPTTGLDHIDLTSAASCGISVFHLRDEKEFLESISATAELTIGLMLALCRKIPHAFDEVKKGYWSAEQFRGIELSGKTLGIVGLGRLGRKVATAASALGMSILTHDEDSKVSSLAPKVGLTELLSEADFISLHIPLTEKTRHLLGSEQFSVMKPESYIINTSRGAIINTSDLLSALKNRIIAGAALDVIESEHKRAPLNDQLIRYAKNNRNLIITPHIGGATVESVEKTDMFILKKFISHQSVGNS